MQLPRGSKTLLVVGAVTFLSLMGTAISDPIRPLFIIDVGSTTLELGLITAVQSLISVLTRVPISALSDRLGRWRLVLLSLLISVGSTALFAFIYRPLWFFPIVSLSALSWSILGPISLVITSDLSSINTRGAIMGIYFTAIGASLFFGPLLCSFLTLYMGYRELFLISSIFPALAVILFATKTKRSEIDAPPNVLGANTVNLSIVTSSFSRIFRVKNVTSMYYAQTVFAVSFGVFSTLFALYAKESLMMASSTIALLFSVRGLINVLIRLPMGSISDRIGRRKPILLAHLLIVVVFALLPFVKDTLLLALLLAIYGVGWGMRVAPDSALISESVESADRPLALALLMTMFDIGIVLGSLMVGLFATLLSTPNLFLICAPILLTGLIALYLLTTETLNK
jgi:MFS family permease